MDKWLRFGFQPHYAPDDGASGGSGGGSAEGGTEAPASGGDGDGSSSESTPSYPDFHKQFPEHLRGHKALTDKSIGDIVGGYVELSERGVVKPGEDATQEEKDAFARAIGRPDGPDGYNVSKPEDWPSSVPWSESGAKEFAANAYAAGLTREQAESLYAENMKVLRRAYLGDLDATTKLQQRWDGELREEYGDSLDRALHVADRAMTLIGEPGVAVLMKEKGIARHPGIVRMLNKAWNAIGEEKIFSGAVDAAGHTTSSVKQRIRSRYNNTNFDE